MFKDPVVDEVRRAREEHAQKFSYNLEKIVEDLQRRQQESKREFVSFEPKRIQKKSA